MICGLCPSFFIHAKTKHPENSILGKMTSRAPGKRAVKPTARYVDEEESPITIPKTRKRKEPEPDSGPDAAAQDSEESQESEEEE